MRAAGQSASWRPSPHDLRPRSLALHRTRGGLQARYTLATDYSSPPAWSLPALYRRGGESGAMEAAQVQADWLVQLAPWAPAAWALLLLFLQGIRATRRRAAPDGAIRLAADSSEQRPLFAVFVNDDDVLEASGFSSSHARRESGDEGEADPAATAEAVLPPPPLAVVLAPLAQALGWSVVVLAHVVYDGGPVLSASLLAAAAHAFAWVSAPSPHCGQLRSASPLKLRDICSIR